jgi:Ca2+-binding EF-hand superfamily protein
LIAPGNVPAWARLSENGRVVPGEGEVWDCMSTSAPEIAKRRLAKVFRSFDYDNNGVVDEEDIKRLARETAEISGKDPECEAVKGFRQGLLQFHRKVTGKVGQDSNKKGEITAEEYRNTITTFSSAEMRSMIDGFLEPLFALLDRDGDGKITEDEFKAMHLAQGLSERDVRGVFAQVDLDGDGYLSESDLREYIYEFYLSNDPNAPTYHVLSPS